jgi:hypothetical protein
VAGVLDRGDVVGGELQDVHGSLARSRLHQEGGSSMLTP